MVPTWLPVVITAVTILCNLGAGYAAFGGRISEAERRLQQIETDRGEKLRDYEAFKADIRSDVAEMKTDLKWIRQSLERAK